MNRTVNSESELDALPVGSVVLDRHGDAALVDRDMTKRLAYAETLHLDLRYAAKHYGPFAVLHDPSAEPAPCCDVICNGKTTPGCAMRNAEPDGREALAELASRAMIDAWTDESEHTAAPYAVADAIIAAGFRRHPEPCPEHERETRETLAALATSLEKWRASRHPEPVKPSREDVRDVIAGHPIGGGYYGTTVGIDEAVEIADAVLALFGPGDE